MSNSDTGNRPPESSEQPLWKPPPGTPRADDPSEEDKVRRAAEIKGNDVIYQLWKSGKLRNPPPEYFADNGETDLVEKLDLALQVYEVPRDDLLPLKFTGYLIGWNDVPLEAKRGTRVTVYVTRGGNYVTAVHQWQRGAEKSRQRYTAGVNETPEGAVAWLVAEGGGKLGRSSREAWEIACEVWPALRGKDVEEID